MRYEKYEKCHNEISYILLSFVPFSYLFHFISGFLLSIATTLEHSTTRFSMTRLCACPPHGIFWKDDMRTTVIWYFTSIHYMIENRILYHSRFEHRKPYAWRCEKYLNQPIRIETGAEFSSASGMSKCLSYTCIYVVLLESNLLLPLLSLKTQNKSFEKNKNYWNKVIHDFFANVLSIQHLLQGSEHQVTSTYLARRRRGSTAGKGRVVPADSANGQKGSAGRKRPI